MIDITKVSKRTQKMLKKRGIDPTKYAKENRVTYKKIRSGEDLFSAKDLVTELQAILADPKYLEIHLLLEVEDKTCVWDHREDNDVTVIKGKDIPTLSVGYEKEETDEEAAKRICKIYDAGRCLTYYEDV